MLSGVQRIASTQQGEKRIRSKVQRSHIKNNIKKLVICFVVFFFTSQYNSFLVCFSFMGKISCFVRSNIVLRNFRLYLIAIKFNRVLKLFFNGPVGVIFCNNTFTHHTWERWLCAVGTYIVQNEAITTYSFQNLHNILL